MYIDDKLWNYIDNKCIKVLMKHLSNELLKNIMENCGIWYSIHGIRGETDDLDMGLEDAFEEYLFMVEDNTILFTNFEQFAEDLDDYLMMLPKKHCSEYPY